MDSKAVIGDLSLFMSFLPWGKLHVHTKQFQFALPDGGSAHVHRWLPEGKAIAAVQIIHGMAEHGGRYARLAQALTTVGFAVYAQDLPGHGRTARAPDELGHFADHGGWNLVLGQINQLRQHIEHEQQQLPLFMLGHSMGSFLLQDYLVEHGRGLAGAVFSASSGDLGPLRVVGLTLLRIEALWYGRRNRSALAETLSFKDFNRKFKPKRTDFDWLSRDAAEVDLYIKDPRCGFRCSCGLWIDLLSAAGQHADPQRLAAIPKNLPVLIVNGSDDPATQGAKGPRALERLYRKSDLKDVSVRIYDDARHELLTETCRDLVTQDLVRWLQEHS
jgi:alpha-beta hydrolase superfamily lysophospholipase